MKPIRKIWSILCGECRTILRKGEAVCHACKTPVKA